MSETSDKIGRAASFTGKLLTTLLWIAIAVVGISAGQPIAVVAAVVYLAYLWVFNGRWLIY